MIEKMKFLSITGHKEDFDRVVERYFSKYEIQFENALAELKTITDLRPFTDTNPYKEDYMLAEELATKFTKDLPDTGPPVSVERAVEIVRTLNAQLIELDKEEEGYRDQMEGLEKLLGRVRPFIQLDYNLSSILHFQYVKFRFGRMPHEYYKKFMSFVYDTLDTIVHTCGENEDYVWLVYFVPETFADHVDAIMTSIHFERFFVPDEYRGTPSEAIADLETAIADLQGRIERVGAQRSELTDRQKADAVAAYRRLNTSYNNFNVRKLAACTSRRTHSFYILCGWMPDSDAEAFQKELEADDKVFMLYEEDHHNISSTPPTKLRNPRLFKPFELFVRMYGLPNYREADPTILLGLTYSILFGFMFGDVGQGLCLCLGGFLLYRLKKMGLAAIIACCGFCSAVFGFLFGSVFGFEDVIEPLWLHPKSAITRLPFIGNLNTVFVVAVALGMGIIIFTMILNIVNSIRTHDSESAFFDTNGAAGLVFYGSAATATMLFMAGRAIHASAVLTVMFLLPLAVIFLKEPLMALVERKTEILPPEKGMFIIQGIFELFEILLSYFSNTLSFVRVGAFAVSHAAMMEVVLMLGGAHAGKPNWAVIVVGNLVVCGMEGLIVGIQVLRLEYYELFSRFYRGDGRAFQPYGSKSGGNGF